MSASAMTKPTIIGLYGISGSGKSYLLNQLKSNTTLQDQRFAFHEGSALIGAVLTHGMRGFKQMSHIAQTIARERAITRVSDRCKEKGETAVIAGHMMLWDDGKAAPVSVATDKDWSTYTHMIYLRVDPKVAASRRKADAQRTRQDVLTEHLRRWQEKESNELRDVCLKHGILFTTISENDATAGNTTVERLTALLKDFQQHSEAKNSEAVENALEMVLDGQENLETMLVLDADKTLAPHDTSAMFWQDVDAAKHIPGNPLNALFKTQGHSYSSFRQATLLYEEIADDFDAICDKVTAKVTMYPEMTALLQGAAKKPHVGAVIVTCGLRTVWERVLEKHGLSHVKVIGGGRVADGYVITGSSKGHVVDTLHEKGLRVLAFGDSPLDMEMFHKADMAYVVVGDKTTRSASMDHVLAKAIEVEGLSALQIVIPKNAGHRLDPDSLPKATLGATELDFILKPRERFVHASDRNAAKLLMTPTRDAANRGPDLRQAHENVGYYLATELLSEMVGLEEVEIQHVQNKSTDGYRFRHEKNTLIIPLMRGGEPMAFGVSKAMPKAGFAHAKKFSDIDAGNWKGKRTIILVDSVINTGASIVEFMEPLREKYPYVRVVVVAGVVQADAVKTGGLAKMLEDDRNLSIVALRKSDNSYKGKGTTDTGHRLFNTTYLA